MKLKNENNVLGNYLDEVNNKIELLLQRHGTKEQNGILFAFRGESKDYGKTKLMPSLFRDSTFVSKEKYLFELLTDYGVIGEEKIRNIDMAIETQHYVAISRMLDITFSILPALYFACSSEENKKEDGKIYVFLFPEHYSPHSNYIENFYTKMLKGMNVAYSKNFKVISHCYSNDRIKAQNGGFIFFQGKEFSPINEIYYETINISSEDKDVILRQLNLLFSINEAIIYPDKEKKAEMVKDKFKKGEYKEKQLTVSCEIHTYFERILYEFNMYKKKKDIDFNRKEYLRKLRKEKEDLLTYINLNNFEKINDENDNCCEERTKEEWIKYVLESFEMLKCV